MADQVDTNQGRVFDANGLPVPGAKAYFYASGTTTLLDVYTDQDGTILAANPAIADSSGILPQRFVTEAAKLVVTTSAGATLYTLDPVRMTSGVGTGANSVTFAPTTNLPYANVQTAIEGTDTAWRAADAAAGIGTTGDGTTIADLDATNTPAGIGYKVTVATTGTFPTGYTSANGGVMGMYRSAATDGFQTWHPLNSSMYFQRVLTAGVWGTWRFIVSPSSAGVEGQIIRSVSAASAWSDPIGYQTEQATTSGTTFSFTSIPSWIKRIDMMGYGISMSASDNLLVRLGTTSGFTTAGYVSEGATVAGTTHATAATDGFVFDTQAAADTSSFVLTLRQMGSNKWLCTHTGYLSTGKVMIGGGSITLAAALDRVRLTSVSGSTFDAGAINISWE